MSPRSIFLLLVVSLAGGVVAALLATSGEPGRTGPDERSSAVVEPAAANEQEGAPDDPENEDAVSDDRPARGRVAPDEEPWDPSLPIPVTYLRARELLERPGHWHTTDGAERLEIAKAVDRHLDGFGLEKLAVFSAGGQSHEVAIFRHERSRIDFVLVPGGTFQMGSPADEPGHQNLADRNEPLHEVTLSPYLIARTEVPQWIWDRLHDVQPSQFEGEHLPVENVTRRQAIRFCKQFGWRLPTEAEWEYACRAGTTSAHACGADALRDFAWYHPEAKMRTHPVGAKEPNAFGLHDMHGNVWEWIADRAGPYPREAVTDPTGPETGHFLLRGGSYMDHPHHLRSACRLPYPTAQANIGFRPVRDLPR